MICITQVMTGEKELHKGSRGITHYQTNIVYDNEPLKLKTVDRNMQCLLDPPCCLI